MESHTEATSEDLIDGSGPRTSAQSLQVVRQWQSEVDAIAEAPPPTTVRSAVWLLALILVTMIATTPFVTVNRVVSSSSGKVVSVQPMLAVQPLDPSIIKSVDVMVPRFGGHL